MQVTKQLSPVTSKFIIKHSDKYDVIFEHKKPTTSLDIDYEISRNPKTNPQNYFCTNTTDVTLSRIASGCIVYI